MSVALNTLSAVPAPATPAEARGVLVESSSSKVVISFPGSDYQLHLAPERPVTTPPGKRILGIIKAQVRRIDQVRTGGQFVEPVMGRPRIIQGRVVEVNASPNGPGTITVLAPMPILLKLSDLQRADQFKPGDLVNTHALPGATFSPLN
ncbi:MAG: hypothetical protein ACKVZJ_02740 [Phycisphaerales bacterium]